MVTRQLQFLGSDLRCLPFNGDQPLDIQKQLMKVTKVGSEKTRANDNHIFRLAPAENNPDPYYKAVVVELSSRAKSSRKKKAPSGDSLCCPRWNDDKLCYTPGFILHQDRRLFEILKDTFKDGYQNHIGKISDESTNISLPTINLPHPRQQNYCGVCKISYKKFQEHVDSAQHKLNSLRSPYTRQILEFSREHGYGADPVRFKKSQYKIQFQYQNSPSASGEDSIKMQNQQMQPSILLEETYESLHLVNEGQQDQIFWATKPSRRLYIQ